jgi:adenosine deaminase
MPHYFEKQQIYSYLNAMTAHCRAVENEDFMPRLALSIARPPEIADTMVTHLIEWLNHEPDLGTAITGVDFCGSEVGHPPKDKARLFRKLRSETDLQILYHVGETLANLTPVSMLRWIDQASTYGAHRLGHATVLGMSPHWFNDLDLKDESAEAQASERWLLERRLQGASIAEIQNCVLNRLAEAGTIIESCPTSNLLIGGLRHYGEHPVQRFVRAGVPVVFGSDDPGIFKTNIAQEFELIEMAGLLSEDQLEQIRFRALNIFSFGN